MRKRELTIPTLLGLFVAIAGLGSGLILLRGQVRQQAEASGEEKPINVRVSNVSDTGFVVSWTTQLALSGYIQYGEDGADSKLVVSDERDQQRGEVGSYFTHYVPVRGLKPSTTYVFSVGSGRGTYDNDGQQYRVTTAQAGLTPPASDVAYGQVFSASNEPADGALVYAQLPGAYLQSTLVRNSGSWVLPVSTARTADLRGYVQYDKAATNYVLEVEGGPMGSAKGIVPTSNHSPVPQITLGSDFDFVNKSEADNSNTMTTSRLGVEASEVKVVTPQLGERVNTGKPVISGEAPAGIEVTIEIHSNAKVIGTAITDQNGNFTFNVPQTLEPGVHTVTVSAFIDGVLQKVTSSFVVYAAGESTIPYYSATPSANLTPVPTISNTPTPTTTMRITPTISLSITPTKIATPSATRVPPVYNPSTDSALPSTGGEVFSVIAALAGLVFTGGGMWWWKKENNRV